MGKHDSEIDAVFADIDALHHPGAAILVIDRDEIIYSKDYGRADQETRQSITTDTSFYLASISKQFTAMAIMLLEEQDRLDLDDHLLAYFPRFPSWGASITLRYLLHHTSGLPGYIQFFSTSEKITELTRSITGVDYEDVLERTMRLPGPEFPVGSQHSYSGVGYVLLAMIVAIASGQSFADFLRLNVFGPLDMKHTLAYDASRPARHKLAHGYLREGDRFERWDYPMLTVGDGGLFSTLSDLFLWDQALNTEQLVSKAALARAFTSATTSDGTATGYGFGWITNVFPYLSATERQQLLGLGGGVDMRHVAHGGSCIAYFNYMIRFLETQRTIIVLTNRWPIAPASAPHGHLDFPGPRVRAHRVAQIVFGK